MRRAISRKRRTAGRPVRSARTSGNSSTGRARPGFRANSSAPATGWSWRDDLGLTGFAVEPGFAIGQRALLVREADGCVLWDCVPLVTPEAIAHVRSLGGLKAIAVSHPHFYGAVADWSEAFGGVPVYLHGDDRQWITRPHPAIVAWSGESHRISDDIALVRTGGHFAGGTIMHWRAERKAAVRCSPATSPWRRWTAAG